MLNDTVTNDRLKLTFLATSLLFLIWWKLCRYPFHIYTPIQVTLYTIDSYHPLRWGISHLKGVRSFHLSIPKGDFHLSVITLRDYHLLVKQYENAFRVCIAWNEHWKDWEDSWQLYKPETKTRVCITVVNSTNLFECLYHAMQIQEKSSMFTYSHAWKHASRPIRAHVLS